MESSPSGAYLDPVRQDIHIVKCVVVGDTGVGKTRLICARACGTSYTLHQLMGTHVPTVWAIDKYRKDREVLRRSWCVVDGVNVSLRLWDTFGYHDKDRRFAYGRADVILLCFSTVRPRSLRNVVRHWYPEIKRTCPGVPIVLCGCQIDLRYLYLDEEFKKIDKGPFYREITDNDIQLPEKGRLIAKEIGANYYETSVLLNFGIEEAFTNVIRAALTGKREKHFWNLLGNLKRICRPVYQEPFLPPKPLPPSVTVPSPRLDSDLQSLLQNQAFCDVIFICHGICIQAHKVCLLAASPVFEELFLSDLSKLDVESKPLQRKTNSRTSNGNGQKGPATHKVLSDTATLLDNDEMETSSVDTEDVVIDASGCLPVHTLNHPAFTSIQLQQCTDMFTPGATVLQTVVTLSEEISPAVFQYILHYLYTGHCGDNLELLLDVRRAADMMGLHDLVYAITNMLNNEDFLNTEVELRFWVQRCHRIHNLFIEKGLLSDVLFQVDDGSVAAHKSLLMARCEVMFGMFSYNFRETSAKIIPFPGVTKDTFMALQEYLYTDQCPRLGEVDFMELIELANRLCQSRLLALAEHHIIQELEHEEALGKDITEEALALLEPAQLHNASHLAGWCLWYISSNYGPIYKKHCKVLQMLKPENQIYLNKHRWPPLWYLKEVDYYEKAVVDMQRQQENVRSYIRRGSDDSDSGCLGFCGRNRYRRKLRCEPSPQSAAIVTL